jgi:hypothetical protein
MGFRKRIPMPLCMGLLKAHLFIIAVKIEDDAEAIGALYGKALK